MTTIYRYEPQLVEVEVPEGYVPCKQCDGRGVIAPVCSGFGATSKPCWQCRGNGFVYDFDKDLADA